MGKGVRKSPSRRSASRKWTLRYLEDAEEERSACGSRRRLLSVGDGTAAFAHLVRIYDSTPHYHKETTELYYVVEGSGTMTLDGEDVSLRAGACLELKPGVVHSVRGDVLVLVVGIPSITDADTFFPEGTSPRQDIAAREAPEGEGR